VSELPSLPERSPAGLALAPVRQIALTRPFHWLQLGWRDLMRVPTASLLHGVLVTAGGWIILGITLHYWYLLPGACSGFLLIGPIVATGLYELSRQLEAGCRPGISDVFAAWKRGTRPLMWLGLLLVLAGTAWVLVSAVLFALFVSAPITGLESVVRYIVLSQGSALFPVWITLGGLGAALVFAGTVVSAPLLLDRDVDMVSALLTSVRTVGENPIAMALWATLIMLATGLAMLTLMLGFVLVIPWIGHATWHAYRDLVDTSGLPART
jgi:uncharacterized membrane protein